MIQGRDKGDGTVIGSFSAAEDANTALSSCTPPEVIAMMLRKINACTITVHVAGLHV